MMGLTNSLPAENQFKKEKERENLPAIFSGLDEDGDGEAVQHVLKFYGILVVIQVSPHP